MIIEKQLNCQKKNSRCLLRPLWTFRDYYENKFSHRLELTINYKILDKCEE